MPQPTLLINLGDAPFEIPPERAGWNIGGLVAFSKICTHAGCPVGLYNVAVPPVDLPLPPIDLRRAARLQAGVRAGAPVAPQLPLTVDREATWCRRATTPSPSAQASGTADEHHRGTGPARKRYGVSKSVFDTVDERFGSSKFLTSVLDKIFPDHWSFMVGEVAMDSLIVLIATGIYLTFFYVPSGDRRGLCPDQRHIYAPLYGQHMSEAYQSVINISFNVRFGLVMRQAHHWAALVFVAAILFHLCRIFFTGAFRKPREINWIIGLTLWMVVILEGFTGYSLPDDLLSGTGSG